MFRATLLYAFLLPLVAAELPGEAAITQMKERGAAAAEDLSRSYGVDGYATDIFHKDESLLSLAVQSGNIKAVEWLLSHGAKIDGHDGRGMPLWFAAFRKDLVIVRLLLARGALPKEVSGRVYLLEPAVRDSNTALTELLLSKGAKPDYTLFLISCTDSSLAMVRLMVPSHGVNDYWLMRCLDFALEKDKFDVVSFMLSEKKAPTSDATLFIAMASLIQRNSALSPKLFQQILDKAQNINAKDSIYFHYDPKEPDGYSFQDKTALMVAAYFNRTDLMPQILQRKPDLNAQTERHYTALHYAAMRCNNDAIRKLLENRADPNRNDLFEKAPMNYALENCKGDTVAILGKAGAEKTILTREKKRSIRDFTIYYGIPIAYTIFAVVMREGVYKDNPQDNWFGRANGVLATTFLLGPLPAWLLVESKTLGLLGAVIAPYLAVIGGIAGLTLGIIYNEHFNDNRFIYYASVAPVFSLTLAQFFF